MKNNNRLYNLLAAGSLTALLVLTFLLFRGNQFGTAVGAASEWTGATVTAVNGSAVNPALTGKQVLPDTQASTTKDPALTTLQAQNAQLKQMVQVMQAREQQYQSQLNAASQALQATQAQSGIQRYEEHEHREHAEHEGFGEYGEHD